MPVNPQQQSYYPEAGRVAPESVEVRAKFIERTYLHLAGAIAAFVGLEYAFLHSETMLLFSVKMMTTSPWLVLIGLLGVSFLADYWARHSTSRLLQYLGLGLYVVAMAVFVMPAMLIAAFKVGPEVWMTAGVSTLAIFAALTGIVLYTKRDFSWLRSALVLGSMVTIGLVIAALAFGFTLGIGVTVFLVFLAAAWILYDTSNVMRHYHPESYVAASLALFSSIVMLFLQLLRLFSRD